MTALEAISILDGFNLRNNADKYDVEALNMAQEALEKRIPKKPTTNKVWYVGVYSGYYKTTNTCPVCNCGLKANESWHDKHCPNCGQAIDWSDED